MSDKTHYRKVFKSDHLGAADLEEMTEDGKKLIFKIKEVKQYLNDNYEGGETHVNKKVIKPKKGKLIFFAGNKMEHGVYDVRQGERYTIPSWWNTL